MLGFEFFVGSEVVPGCAENYRILPLKFSVKITKVLAFGGASGGRILGIKIENDFLATKVLQVDDFVTGRCTLKVFNNTIQYGSCHVSAALTLVSGFYGFKDGVEVELLA